MDETIVSVNVNFNIMSSMSGIKQCENSLTKCRYSYIVQMGFDYGKKKCFDLCLGVPQHTKPTRLDI